MTHIRSDARRMCHAVGAPTYIAPTTSHCSHPRDSLGSRAKVVYLAFDCAKLLSDLIHHLYTPTSLHSVDIFSAFPRHRRNVICWSVQYSNSARR